MSHGQTCTQVKADVIRQVEEKGRAQKGFIVPNSFPVVPQLLDLLHAISLAPGRAGHDSSYLLGTAPKPNAPETSGVTVTMYSCSTCVLQVNGDEMTGFRKIKFHALVIAVGRGRGSVTLLTL